MDKGHKRSNEIIDSILDRYFKSKEYDGICYDLETRELSWNFGNQIQKYKIHGLFPRISDPVDAIQIKYLFGNKIPVGASTALTIELRINHGKLAKIILNSGLNFVTQNYIFELYSSHLDKTSFFKDLGKVSFYDGINRDIEQKATILIQNLERYFINSQILIYNNPEILLSHVDENPAWYNYPFFTKVLTYLKHTTNISEVEILKLGTNNFCDYKYRQEILRFVEKQFSEFDL